MRMPAANANAVAVTVAADNRPDSAAPAPDPASTPAPALPALTPAPAPTTAAALAAAAVAAAAAASSSSSSSAAAAEPSMSLSLSQSRHDAALAAGRIEPYSFAAVNHPPIYRRLAAAPPPHAHSPSRQDALGFPPSPSPTPSHPNHSSHNHNAGANTGVHTNLNSHGAANAFAANHARPPPPPPSRPDSKPVAAARCSVMALQNVLCDPDDDGSTSASRSSHPPTPPHLDALGLNHPPPPPPPPQQQHQQHHHHQHHHQHHQPVAAAPISPATDPLETPPFVARPNPTHVVMTTRPQLQPSHQRTEPGCKTCQIRKMPCDEARPTCQNCSRMGIHCLGYFSPSHASAQQQQQQQATDRSVPSVSANARRQDQEEYLFFLLDHYRHTKRHCMWELITFDFNEHFSCNMRKEALQMIKRRRFKDKDTREGSPNDPGSAPRPKPKRGRRPRSSASLLQPKAEELGNESGTG